MSPSLLSPPPLCLIVLSLSLTSGRGAVSDEKDSKVWAVGGFHRGGRAGLGWVGTGDVTCSCVCLLADGAPLGAGPGSSHHPR
jgi:hypothetical protein